MDRIRQVQKESPELLIPHAYTRQLADVNTLGVVCHTPDLAERELFVRQAQRRHIWKLVLPSGTWVTSVVDRSLKRLHSCTAT